VCAVCCAVYVLFLILLSRACFVVQPDLAALLLLNVTCSQRDSSLYPSPNSVSLAGAHKRVVWIHMRRGSVSSCGCPGHTFNTTTYYYSGVWLGISIVGLVECRPHVCPIGARLSTYIANDKSDEDGKEEERERLHIFSSPTIALWDCNLEAEEEGLAQKAL
jgi:hypothetical protein